MGKIGRVDTLNGSEVQRASVCAICRERITPDQLAEYRLFPGQKKSARVHVFCSAAQRRSQPLPSN